MTVGRVTVMCEAVLWSQVERVVINTKNLVPIFSSGTNTAPRSRSLPLLPMPNVEVVGGEDWALGHQQSIAIINDRIG